MTTDQRTRTLSLVLIVSGAVLALVSLIGIIGVWSISSVLNNRVLPMLNRAEQAVTRLDEGIQRLDSRLVSAQDKVQEIEDRVMAAGLTLEEANLLQLALDRLIGDELSPILEDVRNIINTVIQIADGIEDTMTAVNSIPFVNIEIPGAQQYRELRDQINSLITTVQDLRTNLQNRKVERVQDLVSFVTGYTSRAKDLIALVRAPIGSVQAQTTALQAQLARLSAELPGQIFWSAVVATVVLLWMLLTQLFLIGAGWAMRKGTSFLGIQFARASANA